MTVKGKAIEFDRDTAFLTKKRIVNPVSMPSNRYLVLWNDRPSDGGLRRLRHDPTQKGVL
jgi:hypothetical protein